MVAVKFFKSFSWVVLCTFLVGCAIIPAPPPVDEVIPVDSDELITQTSTLTVEETQNQPSDMVELTPIAEISPEPTPFLRINSQINLLAAGTYLVFYDLEIGTLEALSTQISLTSIGNGNDIFIHSTNSTFALVDEKLVNLKTREKFLVTPLDQTENCSISSISKSGEMLAAGCDQAGIMVFPIGGEWLNVLPEEYQTSLQVFPQLSPDEEQIAVCMNDPSNVGESKLVRANVNACLSDEECSPEVVVTGCEDLLFSWSPDAEMMAVAPQSQGIWIYDFVYGTRTELLTPEQTLKMDAIFWSPDGQRIAFTRTEGTEKKPYSVIYLANLQGGNPRLFYQSDNPIKLVGWLNIISEFKPNARYVVLPSENQYWLKDSPSHDAFNLKLFLADEKVRVLEKSEVVNGEEWWQVSVGDFTGWVVENLLYFQGDWAYGLG